MTNKNNKNINKMIDLDDLILKINELNVNISQSIKNFDEENFGNIEILNSEKSLGFLLTITERYIINRFNNCSDDFLKKMTNYCFREYYKDFNHKLPSVDKDNYTYGDFVFEKVNLHYEKSNSRDFFMGMFLASTLSNTFIENLNKYPIFIDFVKLLK